jgi:hypothetical protein
MDKVVESLLAAMALLIVTFVALGAMTGHLAVASVGGCRLSC